MTTATDRQIHRTSATVDVDAPADVVYRALTDVADWPVLYPWIAHTEVLAREGADDEVKFWAVRPGPEGGLRIWTSKRTLDPVARRMVFEQQGSVGPIEQLGGTWDFVAREGGGCRVESGHWFTTDADPAVTAGELDRHGALQMRTLKSQTESATALTTAVVRVEASAVAKGPLAEVRARLLAALPAGEGDAWFGETEAGPTVQIVHGDGVVVQKLLSPPEPAELLRTRWLFDEEAGGGVRVTADVLAVATRGHDQVRALAEAGVRDALARAGAR